MQQQILSTLATEALKPTSPFIDALLGPKLERMRTSAKRRELRDRLQDPRINDLLDGYFRRLLARVSEIKTLVFPEQAMPITSIYEPLSLSLMAGKSFDNEVSKEKINLSAKDLKSKQNYLIIDSAGMGKSTFSKHLVLDIFQSTIKIPLFLELRRIDDKETLLGKLSKELDADQRDIDEEFLSLLLEQGGYVIILDGYDELSEVARKTISPQITELALRCEKNIIILTSRPEVGLPEMPSSIAYSIQPLEQKQAASLVLRYDAFAKIEVGKRLIGQFDKVSEEFLETPLLLVLLYKTYGYNQSIATNVTSFYDDVYNAFYKGHDLSKAGFSRPKLSGLDQENFRRLLRGFSFLLLTENKYSVKNRTEGYTIIEKAVNLTLVVPSSVSNFFEDLLVSVPFLINDGGEFRFIHKSIIEFFAAEYLASAPNAEKKIKIICQSAIFSSFRESLNFLLELNPSLYRRAILAPAAKAYLKTKELSEDPIIRSLCFCGVSHLCVNSKSVNRQNINGRHVNILIFLDNANDFSKTLGYSYAKNRINLPSSAWLFLGDQISNEGIDFGDITKYRHEDVNQFSTLHKDFPITSKAILKFTKNSLFVQFSNATLSHLQNLKAKYCWILSDKACKKVLKTIQEERKAQSQIDAVIMRLS